MLMNPDFLTVVAIVVGVLLVALVKVKYPPFTFREHCQGAAWRKQFSDASKEEIRAFLILFVDAFGFPRDEMLKFNPSDQILRIYRDIYPSKWMPDALELETLSIQMEKTYGIQLAAIWSDELTLGQLFSCASGMPR